MNATSIASTRVATSLTHAREGGTVVIRLAGDLRHTHGRAFDRFIDTLLADAGVTRVIVDLGAATGIDSTMLGLLARLASELEARDGRKPLLVSPDADINALLESICLDECFLRCDGSPAAPDAAAPIPAPDDEADAETARVILEAHRTLGRMNAANREMFRSVVEALEQELGRG
ncbi:STAS domain-containing protein [Derxia gummosa]|uniref:STAS domain-containing protein n=1 Tax=Derxia gummosa DSM 723 TaxID=1121388 RepID=A0A8B6X2J4_9BURK|nr:STAS domain-containing protein [Derxia gummosa]